MSRSVCLALLVTSGALGGCAAVAGIVGDMRHAVSVIVAAPQGLLVGDSAQVTAMVIDSKGDTTMNAPVTWSSSDPTVLSIDAQGWIKGLVGGGQATITGAIQGVTGTAVVAVSGDDVRFAYALADQPTATAPYTPNASYLYSTRGAVTVTRTGPGLYTLRFAGLGRPPGGRDDVQVSGYGASSVYCKPDLWDASGTDLVVPVSCFASDALGTPADGSFTILVIAEHAFGATAPMGFLLALGDTNSAEWLDTTGTAYNRGGGHVAVGRGGAGSYSTAFEGLGPLLAGGSMAILVTPVGPTPRHCQISAFDLTNVNLGLAATCSGAGGGPRDSPFAELMLPRGRAGHRYGYAWANNTQATLDYTPYAQAMANSTGGTVKARKLATGSYQIVFGGLARPPGATEIVIVSPFQGSTADVCSIVSWATSGANDLKALVNCYDKTGAPVDSAYTILVIE